MIGLPRAAANPASKAAFHCLYFSPKRTTTMSASSSSVFVRMAFMVAPRRSQFGRSSSMPRTTAPQSSLSLCDGFGEESCTGSLRSATPLAMTSRQSECISPLRYTRHVRGAVQRPRRPCARSMLQSAVLATPKRCVYNILQILCKHLVLAKVSAG
eukprot:scaffold102963_cov71-Phaeocystis_antarctica.AAC.3